METKDLKKEIVAKGYLHIPYPHSLTIDEVTSQYGDLIFTTLIKENPQSTRLLSSNNYVDFHTDHIKAKYIAWQCQSQSANGGESLLLDGLGIIGNASVDLIEALQTVSVKSHRLFYGDKPEYPLYTAESNILYYAPFLCDIPIGSKAKEALKWFQEQIARAPQIEIKLSEGDWLIIDNHRMLHARRSFETRSNRLLTRYWLSEQANHINN